MSFYSDHSGQRVHTKNIKRIIAIPGDMIKIEGFIAYIKPRQSENYIKEDLLVKRAYTPLVKSDYFPEGWNPVYREAG
jgi:signal peptidase I